MRVLGYIRVSTEEQADSGLSLDAQRARIEAECTHRNLDLVEIVEDRGVSAQDMNRPGMKDVLERVSMSIPGKGGYEEGRVREADTIMVTRLDRLSRSVADFARLLQLANELGFNVIVLDLGLDLSTPNGKFVAHIMAAVAELERSLISTRTSEAMQAAAASGRHMGRPSQDQIEAVIRSAGFAPIRDVARTTGLSEEVVRRIIERGK